MTDTIHHTAESVMVAIDIAKNSHDALIRFPAGKTKWLKFPNTLDGRHALLDTVTLPGRSIVAAFEPKADYPRNLGYWIHAQGIHCNMISSLAAARAREMLFKTWDKHDRKDA